MVIHTKSHMNIMNLVSLLNNKADHYVSKAQGATHLIPAAPIPTFCMDDFTFYRDSDGWVKSNIHVFTDYFMARQTTVSLSHSHHHHMSVQLYDPRPSPLHPYTRASSAYSVLVQLYACWGQLPMASCSNQRGQLVSGKCRYGCKMMEDMHHIFVICTKFESLRSEAAGLKMKKIAKMVEDIEVRLSYGEKLMKAAKFFFCNSIECWPLHVLTFYLGYVPKLDALVSDEMFVNLTSCTRFLFNISSDFHLAGIRLVSCIWGAVQRDMARRRDGLYH
jgi:hypothetical protein